MNVKQFTLWAFNNKSKTHFSLICLQILYLLSLLKVKVVAGQS